MKIEERIYNGGRAREVLENEAFAQAFTDLKAEITEQWQNSPSRDTEGREKLWMLLSLANKLELILKSSMETGKLARLELEHQNRLAQLAQRTKSYLGRN